MSIRTIFDTLISAGLTREGALGLMGNMKAESGMKANIAQRGMTKLSDEQYTAAADNGLIDFVHDQCGYGLCQWSWYSRKENLLAAARKAGVSVGDEAMQVQFCLKELREWYPNVWRELTSSQDLLQCTQLVCTQYERPAVNNVGARYEFARELEKELGDPEPVTAEADPIVRILQACMAQDGYWTGEIDGIKTPEFRKRIVEYAADVAAC